MICVEIYRPDEISKSKNEDVIQEQKSESSRKSQSRRASLRYQSDIGLADPLMNIGV